MEQVGFYFNMAACIGCKACAIACKDKNDLEVGRNFRRIYDLEAGRFPQVKVWHLSIACNHCDSPACVSACPTGAMHKRKEDGVVTVDHDKCVGCRYCTWACPYQAPQFNEQLGMMTKCDTCADLRAAGENPACVGACAMRALDFGPIGELREKYGNNADAAGLPKSSLTNPNIIINQKL